MPTNPCNYLKYLANAAFVALTCSACQNITTPQAAPRVRIIANSESSVLNLAVAIEGPFGDAVSGGVVTAEDPAGGVFVLPFDARKMSYVSNTPTIEGTYNIKVNSNIIGKKVVSVPVKKFNSSPNLSRITDAVGNEALSFKRLQAATVIHAEWSNVEGAQKYLVEAKQFGKTVWSRVVDTPEIFIPANTFHADNSTVGNSATLAVTATYQQGTIDFEDSNILSYTSVSGLSTSFQVVP